MEFSWVKSTTICILLLLNVSAITHFYSHVCIVRTMSRTVLTTYIRFVHTKGLVSASCSRKQESMVRVMAWSPCLLFSRQVVGNPQQNQWTSIQSSGSLGGGKHKWSEIWSNIIKRELLGLKWVGNTRTVDSPKIVLQVGSGLFGVHPLILHFKFQFSKSIKSSTGHIFLNLTFPFRTEKYLFPKIPKNHPKIYTKLPNSG